MEKNGQLTEKSPCVVCGNPGDIVQRNTPYCYRHADNHSRQMPAAIEKTADLLWMDQEHGVPMVRQGYFNGR